MSIKSFCLATLACAPLMISACSPTLREARAGAEHVKTATPGEDPRIRVLATILRAEDRRIVDETLRSALTAPDAEVRARAAVALGHIASPVSRIDLEAALFDPVPEVRAAAAFALAQLGDPTSVPALKAASSDSSTAVRTTVAWALGQVHVRDGAEALRSLLRDSEAPVQAEACFAAWKLPDPGFAVDPLLDLAGSPDGRVRFAAAYSLGRLGAAGTSWTSSGIVPTVLPDQDRQRVRKRLIDLVSSPDPEVRMQCARGLAEAHSPAEVSALSVLARDPDFRVRINAIRAAPYPGAPIDSILQDAIKDPEALVVRAAVESLGKFHTPEAGELLVKGLDRERRDWMRESAIQAIAQGNPELVPRLAKFLSLSPEPLARAAVARMLAGWNEKPAIEIAAGLLRDPDSRVQAAAVPAASLASGPLAEVLAPVLDSPDPVVRAAVARAAGERLAKMDTNSTERQEVLALLEGLWSRASTDTLPVARQQILDAVASAGQDPSLRPVLEKGLADPDRRVRLKAIEAWKRALAEDVSERVGPAADRPVEDYLEILRWASIPRAAIVTVRRQGFQPGRFTLRLDPREAPLASWNFARLAEKGFYNGLAVHRVVPNFVVQDGDPRGDGEGDPGYAIHDELNPLRFWAGTVGMASDGKDTAGSQWFITLSAQPHLDGRYTAFGRVVQNLPGVVGQMLPGDRVVSIQIYEGDGTEPLAPLRP